MIEINPEAAWAPIPLIEVGDKVRGGIDGPANKQAMALGSRTEFILQELTTPSGESVLGGFIEYSQLREYVGDAKTFIVGVLGTARPGIYGHFYYDEHDKTSLDNGGTVIVTVKGKRLKRRFSGPASVQWFGADPYQTADSSAAFQAAVDSERSIYIDNGDYILNSPVNLPSGCLITGSGVFSRLHVIGCDAFRLAPEVSYVSLEKFTLFSEIAGGARQYRGVVSLGEDGRNNNFITLRDLVFQDWKDCIQFNFTWNSRIDSVSTVNCNTGVIFTGTSVNNSITGSRLVCNSGYASVLVQAVDGMAPEGIMVSDSLLASGEFGIKTIGSLLSLNVSNCIIDLIQNIAIDATDCKELRISNSWLYAVNGCVNLNPLGATDQQGVSITNNTLVVTSGEGRCIAQGGANKGMQISGNHLRFGGSATGVYIDGYAATIGENYFENNGSGVDIYINSNELTHKIGFNSTSNQSLKVVGGAEPVLYKSGTWVPEISADGAGDSKFVSTVKAGSYVRVGDLVTIFCEYTYSGRGSVGNSFAFMTGLPFLPSASSVLSIASIQIEQSAFDTKNYQVSILDSGKLAFRYSNGGGTLYDGAGYMLGTNFPDAGSIKFTLSYIATK